MSAASNGPLPSLWQALVILGLSALSWAAVMAAVLLILRAVGVL